MSHVELCGKITLQTHDEDDLDSVYMYLEFCGDHDMYHIDETISLKKILNMKNYYV